MVYFHSSSWTSLDPIASEPFLSPFTPTLIGEQRAEGSLKLPPAKRLRRSSLIDYTVMRRVSSIGASRFAHGTIRTKT